MVVGVEDSLTPDILQEIANLYNFSIDNMKFRFSYENFIYEVQHGGHEFFMRISHSQKRSRKDILAEFDWIKYLTENGISVITPLPSTRGNLLEAVHQKDFSFYIFVVNRVEGMNFTEDRSLLTPYMMGEWGKLTARLHVLSKTYRPTDPKITRQHWDEENLVKDTDKILKGYPKILSNMQTIIQQLSTLSRSPDHYGLIHQDLHESNLIVDNNKITIIDLDDAIYSWYMLDIAIIFFHYAWRFHTDELSRDQVVSEFLPHFMKGYLSINPLTEEDLRLIPTFVKFRHHLLFSTLAYELAIREEEFSRNLLNNWQPMLESLVEWLDPELLTQQLLECR